MVKLKDYIEKVRAEDYVVLFTTVSDMSLDTVSEDSLELCRELGLLEQEKLQGHYIALMEDGQKPYVVERAALNSKLEELGIPIEVGYDEQDRHTLSNIDYKKHNYFTARGNMNIVVYDKQLGKVVNNVLVDLKGTGKVIH